MTSIDLEALDIDQLAELLAKVHTEMASREKENRKELRAELERRLTAAGYKLGEIFPELSSAASTSTRRKRPAKYRDPQNPEKTGAESDPLRSGCRRSSMNAESTSRRSNRSRCIRFTPRTEPAAVHARPNGRASRFYTAIGSGAPG